MRKVFSLFLLSLLLATALASTASSSGSASSTASAGSVSGGSVSSGGSVASSVASSASASSASSAAAAGGVCDALNVPNSYSRNLGYVVLVGCSGFFLVAVVFFILYHSENGNKVIHVLSFFGCILLALGYFSLWEGIGAHYKESLDHTCHLIFNGRFYVVFVSLPVVVTAFILFCRVEHGAIVGGVGAALLALFSWTLGTAIHGPEKYVWWVIGSLFAVAEVVHLFAVSSASKRALTANGATVANVVFIVISASLLGYAAIWVIGGTGTGYLSPATELAWYVALDAFIHVGVGFALVTSGEAVLEGGFVPLLGEQSGNFHQAYGSSQSSSFAPAGFPSRESRQYV